MDDKELVARLRRKSEDRRETSPATCLEAADRIEALSERLKVAEQMASAATSFLKGCDGGMVSVRQDKALRQALTAWKEG